MVRLAILDAPPVPEHVDPLTEARESLQFVKAAMRSGGPGIPGLSKQHMDLVAQIARLESAAAPRESKLDELARRRSARLAAAEGT